MRSSIALLRTLLVALVALGLFTLTPLASAAPTLARDAHGRFLANVSASDVGARAYQKHLARNAAAGSEQHGHDEEDYAAALQELREEKASAKAAAAAVPVKYSRALKNGVTMTYESKIVDGMRESVKTITGRHRSTEIRRVFSGSKTVYRARSTTAR